jgi:hypothetical protein
MRSYIYIVLAILLSGCATIGSLLQPSSEISYDQRIQGKTGGSKYEELYTFNDVKFIDVFEAAKAGLASANFALRKADLGKGLIVGEHGTTLHDWNVIAEIYLKQEGDDVIVKVIAQGSKDIGLSSGVTSGGWTSEILNGMRYFLRK